MGCISWSGPTQIVIFEGKMDAEGYSSVLEAVLKPFLEESEGPVKFMQDSDLKHTLRRANEWMKEKEINNWWKTPAESPDLNLTENSWHEFKRFLRCLIKP